MTHAQIERSLRQAKRMAAEEAAAFLVVETDDRSPQELAREILEAIAWAKTG